MSQEPPCGVTIAYCRCILQQGRCDGRHLCECGGSWRNEANRQEDILLVPMSWTASWTETVEESQRYMEQVARALGAP